MLNEVNKVKVKFTLEQAMKAQRGSRGIAPLIPNLGTRWGWVVNATPRPIYPQERPGTHCIRGWVDPRAYSNLFMDKTNSKCICN